MKKRGSMMIEFAVLALFYISFMFAILDTYFVLHSVNGMNYGLFQAARFGVTGDTGSPSTRVLSLQDTLNTNFGMMTFLSPSTTTFTYKSYTTLANRISDTGAVSNDLGTTGQVSVYKIDYVYSYLSKYLFSSYEHMLEVTNVNEPY